MKPSKLKEHFQFFHSNDSFDNIDHQHIKKACFEKSGTLQKHGFITTQKLCLEASYKFACHIAKQKKSSSIVGTLIKPCALDIVKLVYGVKERNLNQCL